jgi:hypothetical protein
MNFEQFTQTIEQKSAEIKNEQAEIAMRLQALEQRSVPNVHGASSVGSGFEVKSVMDALASSGNFTAKSVVAANYKSILTQGNASILPTVSNQGVIGQNEISLSAQLPSFGIQEAVVRFSRLSTNDMGAIQGLEGALKKELAIDATPIERECNTFAAWTSVSTQALADQKGINDAISSVLSIGILRALDAHAFGVATSEGTTGTVGTTPLLTALGAVASIQAQGFAATAYLNPVDFVAAQLAVSTTGEFIGIPNSFVGTIKVAAGVPAGSFLATANDGSGLSIALRESLAIDIGVQGDQFVKNLRSVLAELRGLAIIRNPALVVTGSLSKVTK